MQNAQTNKPVPTKRANRDEIDAYYLMAAALSAMMTAEEKLKTRARLMPGGWRNLRLIRVLLEKLVLGMLHTFDKDKQYQIGRQMKHIRLKTVFAPEAHHDPEMFMLPIEDLGILVRASTEECKLRMCPSVDCARCQLGKALDRASFVSRNNRAWWEVFEQATRYDVGMEADEDGAEG